MEGQFSDPVLELPEEIQVLLASSRFSEIAPACDRLELEAAASGRLSSSSSLYALQLLGHLLNNDLPSTRFLWKRIPERVKQRDAEVKAAWKVGQGLWKGDASGANNVMRSFSWSSKTKPMVDALAERHKAALLALLERSYSSILASQAPSLLGLPSPEAEDALKASGWVLDASSDTFVLAHPRKVQEEDSLVMGQVQRLTEYVFHLEQ